ncbi:hypothetical protein P3G55_21850 [Leptospira sp. 96542]|nr:hypothetical protein [Leptospira sp. 96542]
MNKKSKIKLLSLFCLIIQLHCHTFNQTRKLSRKIRGFNEIQINKILKIEKTSATEITISAIANQKDGSIIEEPMCITIYYDPNFEEYRFTQYKSRFVILEECKTFTNTQPLNFKIISQRIYFENKRTEEKNINKKGVTNNISNEKNLIIPLGMDLIFIETQLNYINKFRNYYGSINRPAYIKSKKHYYPFYPLTLTYDLLAGSLHTIGMPFYFACGYGFGRGLDNKRTGVLEGSIVMSIIFTTCPIATVIVLPDGVKVKPDEIEL